MGEREKFGKNGEYGKKSLAKYSHKMTKKGIWTNGDLFGKNLWVWQKLKQDDKRGMSIIVGFTKMTNFSKFSNVNSSKNWRKI